MASDLEGGGSSEGLTADSEPRFSHSLFTHLHRNGLSPHGESPIKNTSNIFILLNIKTSNSSGFCV